MRVHGKGMYMTPSPTKKKNLLDVSSKLNSYHDNFHIWNKNYEKLPVSDVLVIRKDYQNETTVYRKSTKQHDQGICLIWKKLEG